VNRFSPLTLSVGHAVEEQPVGGAGPVLHQAHVVARLDARHRKQLQQLPRAVQRPRPRALGGAHLVGQVGLSLPVAVDLWEGLQVYLPVCYRCIDLCVPGVYTRVLQVYLPVCSRCIYLCATGVFTCVFQVYIPVCSSCNYLCVTGA